MIQRESNPELLHMVRSQLESRGLRDRRVLEAFRTIDRALFVPEGELLSAYEDRPLSIGCGQTISQPYMVAIMTAELELSGGERVLEVGTGSGYQTALLARLAREVYTIECVPELAEAAHNALERLGILNVHYRTGDGTLGWPEASPFDRILAAAAAPDIPPPFIEQLAEGGIALLPIGPMGNQRLLKVRRERGDLARDEFCPCSFVLMRGKHGFRE